MQSGKPLSLEEKEKEKEKVSALSNKLKHKFILTLLKILNEPQEAEKAINFAKDNFVPEASLDIQFLRTRLKQFTFTDKEIEKIPDQKLLLYIAAFKYANHLITSDHPNEDINILQACIYVLNKDAIKFLNGAWNLNDFLQEYFNDFIDSKNNSSLSGKLAHLLKKEPEDVKNFFALSKYFLKKCISESNNKIIPLYSVSKHDPQISEIKEIVKNAENLYLELKKLERAYYKRNKEKSYFQANNKTSPATLNNKTTKKRLNNRGSYDAKHTVENTGLALLPRFLGEKIDPQHRDWRSEVEDPSSPRTSSSASLLGIWSEWVQDTILEDLFSFADKKGGTDDAIYKHKYLDEEERKKNLVKLVDGKIVFTSNLEPLKDGSYIYVMDLQGNTYIANAGFISEKENIKIQHSSFLSGENVKCAGKLYVQNGKIKNIDNSSHHYSPGPLSLNSALNILEKNNMLHPEVKITDLRNVVRDKHISLSKYREACSKLEDNYGITFLNAVKDINLYMKKRAKETQEYGFMSKLFGYSGQDYYDRRAHWESVLTKLFEFKNNKSLRPALIQEINDGIKKFGSEKTGRKDYANKLTALKKQLEKLDHSTYKKTYISNYLTSSKKVYENLGGLSNSVNNYMTAEDKNVEITHLSNFTHRLSGHRLKAKGQSEFLTKAEVKETEFKNSLSGRYKRV